VRTHSQRIDAQSTASGYVLNVEAGQPDISHVADLHHTSDCILGI
jgi:hypothetical protein